MGSSGTPPNKHVRDNHWAPRVPPWLPRVPPWVPRVPLPISMCMTTIGNLGYLPGYHGCLLGSLGPSGTPPYKHVHDNKLGPSGTSMGTSGASMGATGTPPHKHVHETNGHLGYLPGYLGRHLGSPPNKHVHHHGHHNGYTLGHLPEHHPGRPMRGVPPWVPQRPVSPRLPSPWGVVQVLVGRAPSARPYRRPMRPAQLPPQGLRKPSAWG